MERIKLKYLDYFTDRNGKPRYYFRMGKGDRVRLPGTPGGPEFMRAYVDAALEMADRRESARKLEPQNCPYDSRVIIA